MLTSLHIANIAIIESVSVEFGPGLNLMTGETGAGKSIIIDALGLALGGRAGAGLIKKDEKIAEITAVFDATDDDDIGSILAELEIEQGEELILRRRITASGSSRAFINDVPVNLKTMESVGAKLVTVYGQGEGDELLSEAGQLVLLDAYAGVLPLRDELSSVWQDVRQKEKELEDISQSLARRMRERDLLRFQIDEIEKANISPEEEAELEKELSILENAEMLKRRSGETYYAVYEDDDSLLNRFSLVEAALEEIAEIDAEWSPRLDEMKGLRFQLQEIARDLSAYSEKVDLDPARKKEVEQRVSLYNQLRKKYGKTTDDVLSFLDRARQEYESIDADDQHKQELEAEVERLNRKYNQLAATLSEARTRASESMVHEVEKHLADLAMEKARLEIAVGENPRGRTRSGIDSVAFLLQANPGSTARPLAKVASGGEQSRIMLAIKSVIMDSDRDADTLIFDEIDTGVGGKVAEYIGRKLERLAKGRQILCITHLAQVAAYAKSHYVIDKKEDNGSTTVSLRPVTSDNQVEELARMVGGEEITDTSRRLAHELLSRAADQSV